MCIRDRALTEGTKTVLPKNPQLEYKVDGKLVSEWKLVLVSTSKAVSYTHLKFRNNMAAINLLHELELENRLATPEEQETLSKYVGWAYNVHRPGWSVCAESSSPGRKARRHPIQWSFHTKAPYSNPP